jgi:hypothetical protein
MVSHLFHHPQDKAEYHQKDKTQDIHQRSNNDDRDV